MKPLDLIGSFEESDFSRFRNPTIDTMVWGRQRHHIPILLEIDVTAARETIYSLKTESGQGISFTSWLIKCIAQAVSEHKYVHALRKKGKQVVIFDDVDVSVIIERASGVDKTLPMFYIIRKANEKTVADIYAELRTAQKTPVFSGELQIGSLRPAWMMQIFTMLPPFLRNLFYWRSLLHSPFLFKRTLGTVSVSSLTSFGMMGDSEWHELGHSSWRSSLNDWGGRDRQTTGSYPRADCHS